MNLLPDDRRCAIAVGISCAPCPEEAALAGAYLTSLSEQAEELDLRLQLFVDAPSVGLLPQLRALAVRGHCLDLQAALLREQEIDIAHPLQAFSEATGDQAVGVRAADMGRLGLQSLSAVREHLVRCGLGFVNSDYSTRLPEGSAPGFADKNAAMLIKHTQPRRYGEGLLEIPSAGYSAGDFLLTQGRPLEAWCDHLRQCLDFAHDIGGLLWAPALDLSVLMEHDPDCATLRTLVTHARSKRSGKVAFCTYREIHTRALQTETG